MNVKTITAGELLALRNAGGPFEVIDVRTPVEYRAVHARGARLVPLDQLDPQAELSARNGRSSEPLYVICRSGSRAKQACERFLAAGFDNAVAVEGGTLAWEQAGGAVEHGRAAVSLERQVRIAAGSLVLAGAVLALALSSWFALLPAAIGAGLIFAGVTDTCGMGLLLARMPWNQVDCGTTGCSR
ncbi:MAG: rhodanese-like domain-containing protein [Planctomycetia bacterium]|nr:rhodanese-like domain-containing protein [Planctomycetia bacterium]